MWLILKNVTLKNEIQQAREKKQMQQVLKAEN